MLHREPWSNIVIKHTGNLKVSWYILRSGQIQPHNFYAKKRRRKKSKDDKFSDRYRKDNIGHLFFFFFFLDKSIKLYH